MAGLGGIGAAKLIAIGIAGAVIVGGGRAVLLHRAPVTEGQVAVAVSPAAGAAPEPAAAGTPQRPDAMAPAMPGAVAPVRPAEAVASPPQPAATFDVVRVEPSGATVIAGRGAPGQVLDVIVDGMPETKVAAGTDGQFVAFLDLPPSDAPRLLDLGWTGADGRAERAAAQVIIAPTPGPEPAGQALPEAQSLPVLPSPGAAPAVPPPPALQPAAAFLADAGGVTALAPEVLAANTLSIDAISYGPDGAVVVQGRSGTPGQVALSLDGRSAAAVTLVAPGRWRAELTGVAPGRYALGAALSGPSGETVASVASPFLRMDPADLAAKAQLPGITVVTVQPGYSLWRIAQDRYGDGLLYVQVFEKNRDRISDPDLIYPGQLLTLPE